MPTTPSWYQRAPCAKPSTPDRQRPHRRPPLHMPTALRVTTAGGSHMQLELHAATGTAADRSRRGLKQRACGKQRPNDIASASALHSSQHTVALQETSLRAIDLPSFDHTPLHSIPLLHVCHGFSLVPRQIRPLQHALQVVTRKVTETAGRYICVNPILGVALLDHCHKYLCRHQSKPLGHPAASPTREATFRDGNAGCARPSRTYVAIEL